MISRMPRYGVVMERRHEFFRQAVVADLTGEQYRVLLRLLSNEVDGEIVVKQNELADDLDMTESNVSRSIKALIEAGLVTKYPGRFPDSLPVFRIEKPKKASHLGLALDAEAAWNALYDAHVLFAKELYTVHASLGIFRIIGLNTKKLKGAGTEYVRFSSILSQRAVVLGIESLFERRNDGAGLCSVRGILALAQNVELKNLEAPKRFVRKYGIDPSSDWRSDVENVLEKQRPLIASCAKHTSKARNRRMAHLAQDAADAESFVLPSIDTLERVVQFAYDFYVFIATGFLQSANGAELHDKVAKSLFTMLKERFEIHDARYDFEEEAAPLGSR